MPATFGVRLDMAGSLERQNPQGCEVDRLGVQGMRDAARVNEQDHGCSTG